MATIRLDYPEKQIDFANSLREVRSRCLQESLLKTVSTLEIAVVDSELHSFVDHNCISLLASHGMRGELLFAVPSVLNKNPYLLTYYRLLLGYSQKEFYSSQNGTGIFKCMEEKGRVTDRQSTLLEELCILL